MNSDWPGQVTRRSLKPGMGFQATLKPSRMEETSSTKGSDLWGDNLCALLCWYKLYVHSFCRTVANHWNSLEFPKWGQGAGDIFQYFFSGPSRRSIL